MEPRAQTKGMVGPDKRFHDPGAEKTGSTGQQDSRSRQAPPVALGERYDAFEISGKRIFIPARWPLHSGCRWNGHRDHPSMALPIVAAFSIALPIVAAMCAIMAVVRPG